VIPAGVCTIVDNGFKVPEVGTTGATEEVVNPGGGIVVPDGALVDAT
jgi:hypothetical protein